MYSCTCPDYYVVANMCKHIHLVGRLKFKQSTDIKQPSIILHTQMNDMTSALSLGKKATTTLDEAKRIARQRIQHLTALIEDCQNEDLISDTNKSIRILKSDLHVLLFLHCLGMIQAIKIFHHKGASFLLLRGKERPL